MEVVNKYTTEEVFNFFRNVLNILPTRNQKQYIASIHENDHSIYYKKDRQIGETVAINGYLIWLLYMARISQEKITIVMAGETFYRSIYNMDCLKEILANSALSLNHKRNAHSFLFEEGSQIKYLGDVRSLRGCTIDHLYVNGMVDPIEMARVSGKIMRTFGVT